MPTEEQTTQNNDTPLGYHTGLQFQRVGQSLTISNRYVTKLGFWLYKVGTPSGNVTFAIYKTSDGSLLGSKLLGTASSLSVSLTYYAVTFDNPIYVNESVYICAVDTNYDNDNYVRVGYQTTDVKASENFAQFYSGAWYTNYPNDDCAYIYTYYSGNLTAPSVTTQAVTAITATTATGNGNVTNLGAPEATQYGHVWATHTNPTTSDSKTENGVPSATGAYTSSITGLTQNTLYYVRAYITHSHGTFYGAQVSFTTSASTPAVTTDLVTYIAVTTALGNGSIDNNGGSAVTEHGVCWSVNANPTTADSKTTDGATDVIGGFFSLMTGLTAETLYHVRAYATNTSGTGYGADLTFTTLAAGAPIVTTEKTTNIQAAGATGNGTIVDIGASAVTEHGHCWSSSSSPTTADSKTTKGAGVVGAFTSAITGLSAGTTYYTRAYATNSYGTAYGNNDEFRLHGEGAGILVVLGEYLAYLSSAGNQRALLGGLF